jgi:secreted Zn-dependent insulinase-like peptidase
MLRKLGPQKWVFDELEGLSRVQFRFKDKEKPQSYVCSLASKLQYYPMEEVISGDYSFKEWKPDLVTSLLDMLTPEKIRFVTFCANIDEEYELIINCYLSRSIAVIGKKFEAVADSKETWYGTAYKMEKIDLKDIETWGNAGLSDKLHMPHRNEFIPEKLDLVPREEVAKRFFNFILLHLPCSDSFLFRLKPGQSP